MLPLRTDAPWYGGAVSGSASTRAISARSQPGRRPGRPDRAGSLPAMHPPVACPPMEPTEPGSAANVPAPTTPRFKSGTWWSCSSRARSSAPASATRSASRSGATRSATSDRSRSVSRFAGQYLTYGFVDWWYCRQRAPAHCAAISGLTVRLSDAWAIAARHRVRDRVRDPHAAAARSSSTRASRSSTT